MKARYNEFNPKRRILKPGAIELARLNAPADVACYGGNPEHKRNPGDSGLTPPSDPRPAKSLCDAAEFLCPIDPLVAFLDGDFSESAVEDAAERFSVSERTVDTLLMNNGYLEDAYLGSGMPYRLAG